MQFFGFSTRAVSDCGNCNLRIIGTVVLLCCRF
jgi:hypothetical protein